MADFPLRLTSADYARVMPLAAGQVRAEGIALDLVLGRDGSWPLRAQMLSRALSDPDVQGGEGSMGQHVRRVAAGDRSHVALPVFLLRGFLHRDLYVRKGGAVRTPADLAGRKVGMYSWFASGSIWYRQAQADMGVPVDQVEWVIGDIETAAPADPAGLPAHARPAPAGRAVADLLAAGEIDAMWSPPRPRLYHPLNGPIVRLLPDFRPVERDYWDRFRFWPAMHLLIVRRAAWEAHPRMGRALVDAFNASDAQCEASQLGFPVATPWLEAELEETGLLMGQGYGRHGVEANRAMLDLFCATAFELGLTARRVTVEEYFAEYLAAGGV